MKEGKNKMTGMNIEESWKRSAQAILGDHERARMHLDEQISKTPEFYARRIKLLDNFFRRHKSPVDICLILYGALWDSNILGYHLEGNNLLYYRPKASHRRDVKESFLVGNIDQKNPLLLFDQDIVTGDAFTETALYFQGLGYPRKNIFGYADSGWITKRSKRTSIDSILYR